MPNSPFGVSVWVKILLDKFLYHRPTGRLIADLATHGLNLSAGTIAGGLQRLVGLFEPIYQKLIDHNRLQSMWNADETRWAVFEKIAGKEGNRWYFWLFESSDCAVFVLDKGRSRKPPEDPFGKKAKGVVVVDRYSSYKAMEHVKEGRLRLAFCWAHVRRDFLDVEKSYPKRSDWTIAWVERIGQLYRLNKTRLEAKKEGKGFAEKDKDLREAVERMRLRREEELADEKLHVAQRKVLESLGEHWEGLTIFVEEPSVPMDNNQAERTLRKVVLGRKNYLGSGSQRSGELAAMIFSLTATLLKRGICPRKWLTGFLEACAEAGGKSPKEVEKWLPWNLTEGQKKEMRQKEEDEGEPPEEKEIGT